MFQSNFIDMVGCRDNGWKHKPYTDPGSILVILQVLTLIPSLSRGKSRKMNDEMKTIQVTFLKCLWRDLRDDNLRDKALTEEIFGEDSDPLQFDDPTIIGWPFCKKGAGRCGDDTWCLTFVAVQ